MADNLIFPIGFDLEEAVKNAGQEWNSTYADKLEKLLAKRPINVRLQLDVKSITDLTAKVSGISGLSPKVTPKIDTSSFEGALKSLQASLQAVDYESLTDDEASAIATLTKAVNSLARAYAEKNKAAALEDRTTQELKAATAAEKRAKAELATAKAIEQRGKKEANVAIAKANQTKAEENAAAAARRRASAEEALVAAQNRRKKSENDLAASAARMEKAQLSLANAQNKAANATRNANREFRNQDGYVSRLIKRLAVYASFSMVADFLRNVREVTAQFELQRVSLGAIIQDQERANQLFAEIKSFALTSPLKILDLTTYTKQVAAYGFETEKLFDTTKMLADISVGLGTDMSRATLFFGQAFATGYLRASELRQATEMGIPLVAKLSEKLEELNGRAYSAADVMDLISKRAISFEMVESVFKDMTSAGGEFYNMQVKQSQTLFGMWSKLGDAAALMYDEIGNTSSVNAGMKALIGALESLMRNWQTTARVLDTVAAAVGVYVIGLKNAAIASKALAGTTALLNLAHKQQIIQTPKIIAAIIGANNATKISTILTKAHTGAVLRHATATNVLTKGFWKLTAAMLANPWVAVATAIAAVGVALFHFIGNAETATERAEKLNNSVAALKNLDDTTKPLIDTYNELINKTERTAEEQKKLSEVTHELAKQYPGAITAIGEFGEEVDLAADKLNNLYQAERQARMENTRYELEKTETKIRETNGEIEKLQKKLESGTKTVYRRLGDSWLRTKKIVPLTEEDKGEILRRINELRYGEDGQSGLKGLQKSAEETRRALGLIPSEAAQAIDKFGGWKKTLTTFRQQVGDVRVQLFDDSTIAQFGSLDEALKKTAEEYKKNIALVATYNETLKGATLTEEERVKIEGEKAEADAMATLAKKALEYYNALSLLNSASGGGRTGGTRSDNRLSQLREIEQTLTTINSKYEELLKKEGQTKALADIQKIYGDTLKYINKLAGKFGLNFAMPTEFSTLQEYLKAIQDVIEKLKMKGYEKAALELETKIGTGDVDKLGKELEEKIKTLADKISRTKTAREFYDKVLGATGDVNLAGKVALSIYGSDGNDLKQQLAKQIRELTNGLKLPGGIISADNIVDYKALREWAELNKNELGKTYDELVKIAEQGQKDLAKTYEGYLKDLEKAKSYSDKRIELARYTANKIAEINASTLPQEEKERLTTGYREREDKEAAKLEYEAFKDLPIYTQMFDDLEHASTSTLTNMRDKLMQMREQWKDLDPTQLKELQSRLNDVESQLASRNPFKTLSDSIKEYRELQKTHGSESKLNKEIDVATDAYIQAKADLEAQLASNPDDTEAVENLRKRVNLSEEELKQLQKIADAYKRVKDLIGLSLGEVFQMARSLGDLASGIGKITEVFGGSEEDVQYWNDIANGINEVTSGIQGMVDGALSLNPAKIVSSAISTIPNIISGFSSIFSAGKIRRANKEIKRQQELLEQLEYAYGRLEKAADKAFGRDFINNFKQQRKHLEAQAKAYKAMAAAERSKGKKADEDKIKEYENSYRDTMDRIADMEGQVAERMLGTDLTSAARDFAKAWLEAYKEFGNTADAMSKKFKEMIENMVVEGVLTRVMQRALQPAFDMIDSMNDADFYSESFWKNVVATAEQGIQDADMGAKNIMRFLEQSGISLREAGAEFSGIKRDIASASEESITGLAAGINTQNYYISYVPKISENVAAIRMLMEGGSTTSIPTASTGWTDWQQQAMDNYVAIQRNTADAVVECRRIALACEEEVAQLRRVIVPRGTKGSHGVQVYM